MAASSETMKVTRADSMPSRLLRTDRGVLSGVRGVLALVIMAPVQCMLFFAVGVWSGQLKQHLPVLDSRRTCSGTPVRTLDGKPSDLPSMLVKAAGVSACQDRC